jgi:hypothetical protein
MCDRSAVYHPTERKSTPSGSGPTSGPVSRKPSDCNTASGSAPAALSRVRHPIVGRRHKRPGSLPGGCSLAAWPPPRLPAIGGPAAGVAFSLPPSPGRRSSDKETSASRTDLGKALMTFRRLTPCQGRAATTMLFIKGEPAQHSGKRSRLDDSVASSADPVKGRGALFAGPGGAKRCLGRMREVVTRRQLTNNSCRPE